MLATTTMATVATTTRARIVSRAGDAGDASRSSRARAGGRRRGEWMRRTRRGVVAREAATSAADAATAASDDVVIAEETTLLSNENGAYTVRGRMRVRGTEAVSVYNLLTDYEASPRVFRAVRSVEGVEGEGDECVATNVYIRQECEWRFFVFGGAFPCTFEVEERDEEMKMKCSLAPKQRGMGFLRQFEGSWSVENTSDGVEIEHVLMVQPKLTPPYASKIFVQQVEQIMKDIAKEIASWRGAVYEAPPHRR